MLILLLRRLRSKSIKVWWVVLLIRQTPMLRLGALIPQVVPGVVRNSVLAPDAFPLKRR